MNFTYDDYCGLINALRDNGYALTDYHDYEKHPRCAILRHDVDNSLPQAARMAELEAEHGVKSTYFILLRTDFYNAASASAQRLLRRMLALGHEIGLHFDEAAYPAGTPEETVERILRERDVLSAILQTSVTTVSMHRPSKATLEADLKIPGMVNSYGDTFFRSFKYLSDSRRRWREPVESIVGAGTYDRLHILTHPFWYHVEEQSICESVSNFVNGANRERYAALKDNIADVESIISESEVC